MSDQRDEEARRYLMANPAPTLLERLERMRDSFAAAGVALASTGIATAESARAIERMARAGVNWTYTTCPACGMKFKADRVLQLPQDCTNCKTLEAERAELEANRRPSWADEREAERLRLEQSWNRPEMLDRMLGSVEFSRGGVTFTVSKEEDARGAVVARVTMRDVAVPADSGPMRSQIDAPTSLQQAYEREQKRRIEQERQRRREPAAPVKRVTLRCESCGALYPNVLASKFDGECPACEGELITTAEYEQKAAAASEPQQLPGNIRERKIKIE